MCDFSLTNLRLYFLILSLSVAGCSSTPTEEISETPASDEVTDTRADEVQDIEDPLADSATNAEVAPEAGGPDPDEIEVVLKETGPDPALVGLLRFFSNLDRGLVVFDIDWSSPLSQQNPGIDCELRHLGKGIFQCIVGAKNLKTIVRVEEARDPSDPKARRISRITLETTEPNSTSRLKKELGTLGFRFLESKNRQKVIVDSFVSSTGDTKADVFTYTSKGLVTLSLKPSGPLRKSEPKLPKQSRASAVKKGVKKAKK